MKNTPHPSAFIKPEWQSIIKNTAAAAEQLGRLHPEQLALLYQQKWFKALMPTGYGGLNLTLPRVVRLQEALSWADGSFGWVFTLCCGAGWFAGFIEPDLAKQLFEADDTCLAGSGKSTGEAICTPDGYLVNGQWNYASGAYHATHFTANCTIKNDGNVVLNDDGSPLILPFIIDKKDVELLDTWKYMGMIATGSTSFKVNNLPVRKNRCFKIGPGFTTIDNGLYKYPFLHLAEATLAANIMGMAFHFIDLAADVFEQFGALDKYTIAQRGVLADKIKNTKAVIQQIRNNFYDAVDTSWKDNNAYALQQVSKTSRQLAQTARKHVDGLYPFCGLQAASPDTELNRVWRDLHTASQHSLLIFES